MLLHDYELTISLPACNPSSQTVNALAELSDDLGEVLPYLNAIVKGGTFDPEGGILRFAQGGRTFTVYRDRVAIGKVADAGEAREAMEWLKGLINSTYEHRQTIEPSYRRGTELNPLQVYKLLPRSNCKECGEATCFAFAARLLKEEVEVAACRPLSRPEHREKREGLLALLREVGRA
jgi:ArsR family metal-binding transcriptional regulator